jgi:hypothetical protein
VTELEDYEEPTKWVVISSFPDSASIYINDKYKGVTTFQQELPYGKYNLRLDYPMYHTKYVDFEIDDNTDTKVINQTLFPDFGELKITSYPENGASVYVDGVNTGKQTPCHLEKIRNGEHEIIVRHKWYSSTAKKVKIVNSGIANVEMRMFPNYGTVELNVDSLTSVYLDGKNQGVGTWNDRVISGFHVFEVRKARHKNVKKKVEVLAGKTLLLNMLPKPMYGKLKIVTVPPQADIFVDGKGYGKTPKTFSKMLIGDHEIELIKNGFGKVKKDICIENGQTVELREKLLKGKDVKISAKNRETKIYVDGELLGYSPLKKLLPFGEHNVRLVVGGEEYDEKINVTSYGKSQWNIVTKADDIISYSDTQFANRLYATSKEGYLKYLSEFPDGYRYNYAVGRLRKIDKIRSRKNITYANYQYDNLTAFGFNVGYLKIDGIGGYGAMKYGIVEDEVYSDNLYFSGGINYMITYPVWLSVGLGVGIRDVQEEDDNYLSTYEIYFEIYPEVGVVFRLGDYIDIMGGIQYSYLDRAFYPQIGLGFCL